MKISRYNLEVALHQAGCISLWHDDEMHMQWQYWLLPPGATVRDIYDRLPSDKYAYTVGQYPVYAEIIFKEKRDDLFACNAGIVSMKHVW